MVSGVCGCQTTNRLVPAPSTNLVKANVSKSSLSVSEAKKASIRSSAHIKSFKTDAERIDYKATRALELL